MLPDTCKTYGAKAAWVDIYSLVDYALIRYSVIFTRQDDRFSE